MPSFTLNFTSALLSFLFAFQLHNAHNANKARRTATDLLNTMSFVYLFIEIRVTYNYMNSLMLSFASVLQNSSRKIFMYPRIGIVFTCEPEIFNHKSLFFCIKC